jgi:hypothetical protein
MTSEFMPPTAKGSPVVPRANDVYAGIRLVYQAGFEAVFLERRTLVQLGRVVLPCLIVASLTAFTANVVALGAGAFEDRSDANQQALAASIGFVAFGAGFLLWSVRRQQIGIASWQVVVDGRAGAADAAVHEAWAEVDRRLGAVGVDISQVRKHGQWAVRIRLRTFRCYVSIFPFGSDLFVGWAMLEEPNFWNVFGGWLADFFRGRSWFAREMRSYGPKALRDVVHHATREAVAAAAVARVYARTETASASLARPTPAAAPVPGRSRLPSV